MCHVMLDLMPLKKLCLSPSGKSGTIMCEFSGWLDGKKTVSIEVLFTRRVTGGKQLTEFAGELAALLTENPRQILRVIGKLRCLRYQERDTGKEVERYQVVADSICPSCEKKSCYSNICMEGFVRPLSNAPIVKGDGKKRKASFWVSAPGEAGDERVGYLNLLVDGYDGVAAGAERMKLREKSHVLIAGKLMATSFEGVLGVRLYDVNYAALPAKQKKETKENE